MFLYHCICFYMYMYMPLVHYWAYFVLNKIVRFFRQVTDCFCVKSNTSSALPDKTDYLNFQQNMSLSNVYVEFVGYVYPRKIVFG